MNFQFLVTIILLFYCNLVTAVTYKIGIEDIEYYPHYGKISSNSSEYDGFAKLFFDDFSIKKNTHVKSLGVLFPAACGVK